MRRKGIILAGGSGSRLSPLTKGICKQLLPVYDKPMIYYPLSILMFANIKEILLISNREDLPILKKILGNGSDFGLQLSYEVQESPDGLAQAFLIGEKFLDGYSSSLVLGDNLLVGQDVTSLLLKASNKKSGATVFGYRVKNPEAFGVIDFDENKKVISIEEKPTVPKSNYVVPGIYFYDGNVCKMAKTLKPSKRGELEITDLNKLYLKKNLLSMELLGRGTVWLDLGTHESLHKASVYIKSVQDIQGFQIANLEEIALNKGWISTDLLRKNISEKIKSDYYKYLVDLFLSKNIDKN
ncbi:RfbA dTDP-glucose pyrophosphorylase [Candidatus Pelagibacterales bacterium]